MAATTMQISRERKMLISQYATAAINLYGVISADEFVEVFNRYEDAHTTSEEALLALTRLAKTDDVDYSVSGEIISGPEFQPDFDDYDENVEAIRDAQRGKPRYLPSKGEFLKYVDGTYREPEKPYADLKAYILKHKLTPCADGLDGVDGDLIDLHEMIQFGVASKDEIEYFTRAGYKYKDMDEANGFSQMVMDAHNHTRMYDNNGFTPNEIFEQFERQKLKPLLKEPFSFKAAPKVRRNDLCPCGSGQKYKKCCRK